MSKYTEAAELLERQAAKYEALNGAAAVLKELGSLDNIAAELKKSAIKAKAEEARVAVDLKEAVEKADQFARDQAAKQKEAESIYGSTIAEANQKALDLVNAANTKAVSSIEDSRAKALKLQEVAERFVAGLEQEKAVLTSEVAALSAKRDAVLAEADAAEKRLAKVKEQIANLAKA